MLYQSFNKFCPILYLLALFCGFCSCATIINSSTTKVNIHVSEKITIKQDTSVLGQNTEKVTIITPRKKEDLILTIEKDNLQKTVYIPSKISGWYRANFFLNFGIGATVDINYNDRFTYPKHLYFNLQNSTLSPYKHFKKSEWVFHIDYLGLSSMKFLPERNDDYFPLGIGRLGVGATYYYKKNKGIKASLNTMRGGGIPPIAIDFESKYVRNKSTYLNVMKTQHKKELDFSYGLTIARNSYNLWQGSGCCAHKEIANINYWAIGIPVQLNISSEKNSSVFWSINYRPTFYRIGIQPTSQYEHLIYFTFGYQFWQNN